MKRFFVILWVCAVLLAATPAFANGIPGVTSSDFSTRFIAAFGLIGEAQDVTDSDLHTTAEGYEVFTCKVNDATLTTTAYPDTDILKTVELSFPYEVIDDMMGEVTAVVSSLYTDDLINTRIGRTTDFLNELTEAINNSSESIARLDIEGYSLALDFGGANIVYTFSLSSDNGSSSANHGSPLGGISSGATASQKNAVSSAKSYLDYTAFSRQGLIDQLEYEGYSNADAVYGADHSGADWKEQAAKSAKNYLAYTAFSEQGLIEQLEYEGFTHEQAVYGASAAGFGGSSSSSNGSSSGGSISQSNAVSAAKNYLEYAAFSRQGLIDQLEYEGYSNADAVYGADHSGADWKEQAVKSAKNYLAFSAFSRKELIDQLEYEGFTHEQAVYGADGAGM
jgi:SOS response regulatory protein OraA/RecX